MIPRGLEDDFQESECLNQLRMLTRLLLRILIRRLRQRPRLIGFLKKTNVLAAT